MNPEVIKKKDEAKIKITGHVKILAGDTEEDLLAGRGEVVLDKFNAIHPENFSIMVARGIADRDNGTIYSMYFGSGGATVDPLGNVSYAAPNTTGVADLNTPVFFEVVNDRSGAPAGNQMSVRHITGTLFSDVEVLCLVAKNQPYGQPVSDNSSGLNLNTSPFVFSEIGLKTQDNLLVTHVTFSPIEKSATRIWLVSYQLRIRITTA
jgi:hypothetical protein